MTWKCNAVDNRVTLYKIKKVFYTYFADFCLMLTRPTPKKNLLMLSSTIA